MTTDTTTPVAHDAVDVRELRDRIPHWAHEQGLVPIRVLPVLSGLAERAVDLSPVYDAQEFLALAARLEARAVYVEDDSFSPEDVLSELPAELDDPDEDGEELSDQLRAAVRALRQEAAPYAGQVAEVAMVFCVGPLAHFWSQQAGWRQELDVRQREIDQAHEQERQTQRAQRAAEREERERAREEAVGELTEVLAADGDFRAAKRNQRMLVAEQKHPQTVGERGVLYDAVRAAALRVDEESARIFQDFESRLDELAGLVETGDVLQGARTATTKRIRLGDFLTHHSGGYPAPSRTVDLLLEHLKRRPTQPSLL